MIIENLRLARISKSLTESPSRRHGLELSGRVAVVTGAGSGMGRTFSVLFAKEGAKVVVADINQDSGLESVKLVKQGGGEATFAMGDISKASGAEHIVKACLDAYGRLDILVNNAGLQFM